MAIALAKRILRPTNAIECVHRVKKRQHMTRNWRCARDIAGAFRNYA